MKYKLNSNGDAVNQFIEIKKTAKDYFGKLSNEALNRKPAPDKWSAAECIEHLNITAKGYLNNMPKEITIDSKTRTDKGEYKPRLLIRKFAELTGPDSSRKMPAPKFLIAQNSNLNKSVLDEFIRTQDAFISIINKVNLAQLKNVKVVWPAMKFIKLQLGEILIMTIAHQLRHINQAKRAVKK